MNRGIATMLTVTLFTAVPWTAGALHARATARVAFTAPSTPAPGAGVPPVNSSSDQPSTFDWSSIPGTTVTVPSADEDAGYGLDRFGNDVSPAIATYKSDGSGSVYEEHSPHTEMPRLRPPTT